MVAYSFKARFVDPIKVGLGTHPSAIKGVLSRTPIRPKRQTIRAFGRRRHARPGEIVQLYTGMRTKQCKQIGAGRCTEFGGVLLKWSEWPSYFLFDLMEREPGVWRRVGELRPIDDLDSFAQADGFADFSDMKAFWMETHGPATFEGAIIRWEAPS